MKSREKFEEIKRKNKIIQNWKIKKSHSRKKELKNSSQDLAARLVSSNHPTPHFLRISAYRYFIWAYRL